MSQMTLTSPDFQANKEIPSLYTCQGKDISPTLDISGVPKGTESLALIMDDPDAPGGTWVHWVLWNIPPGTTEIAQGHAPVEAQKGINSWQRPGYGGPCPPSGTHRYFFRLYALSQRLTLSPNATRQDLDKAMQGKILAQCELMGTYKKR